jgi:Fe-S-cluster containining protein
MTAESPPAGGLFTTTVTLGTADWEMQARLSVPAAAVPLRTLLPMVQSFTDHVVGAASAWSERQGEAITCRQGCGACCRQLVPLSEPEGRHIADLLEALPEPRRSQVQSRFAEARQRLAEAGLLDDLLEPARWTGPGERERRDRYFQLRIACPFLEDESCSIHADRPLACREYLVTSPAEHCADPKPETVRRVGLPLEVWPALAETARPSPDGQHLAWVPLIVAPAWAEAHAEPPERRPGQDWLKRFLENLSAAKPLPPARITEPLT